MKTIGKNNLPISNMAHKQTEFIEDSRKNRTAINKIFREHDESHLWPIKSRFNATERAIKQAQKFNRETGIDMAGLEYCLFLEDRIIEIVNSSV